MHLSEYDIANYLGGTLLPEAHQRMQAHAAMCPDCAAALADAVHLLEAIEQAPDPPALTADAHRRAVALGGRSAAPWYTHRAVQAALASVTLLVLVIGWWQPWSEPEMTFRAPRSANAFSAIAPEDGVAITELPIRFVWFEAPGVQSYQVAVFTEAGTAVWEAEVDDTHLDWQPDAEVLTAGQSYFWRVQAVQGDGTLLGTDLYLFRYAVE
ncbi:MAG: hypothetical protein RhofKO_16800 [Rhodothermales bacterium]